MGSALCGRRRQATEPLRQNASRRGAPVERGVARTRTRRACLIRPPDGGRLSDDLAEHGEETRGHPEHLLPLQYRSPFAPDPKAREDTSDEVDTTARPNFPCE